MEEANVKEIDDFKEKHGFRLKMCDVTKARHIAGRLRHVLLNARGSCLVRGQTCTKSASFNEIAHTSYGKSLLTAMCR